MHRLLIAFLLLAASVDALSCGPCRKRPTYADRFTHADAVYMVTITNVQAEFSSPDMFVDHNVTIWGYGQIREVFKGTPRFHRVESRLLRSDYDGPQVASSCGKGIPIVPGDNVLVFDDGDRPIRLSRCNANVVRYRNHATRKFDPIQRLRQWRDELEADVKEDENIRGEK